MAKKIYKSLLIVFALTGVIMLGSSLRYPWCTVSEDEVAKLSIKLEDKPREERFREWYTEREKLNTLRPLLNDTATGLLALAATLSLFQFLSGFPLRGAQSPRRRWMVLAIYLFALAIQLPSAIVYYGVRQSRFEYPHWADSIAIPIAQTVMGCLFFAVVGSLFFGLLLAASRFPAPLYVWSNLQRTFNIVVSLIFGTLAVLSLLLLPAAVRDGNIGGIVMILVLSYLFLSIRAGLIVRSAEKRTAVCSERD